MVEAFRAKGMLWMTADDASQMNYLYQRAVMFRQLLLVKWFTEAEKSTILKKREA